MFVEVAAIVTIAIAVAGFLGRRLGGGVVLFVALEQRIALDLGGGGAHRFG